MSKSTTSLSIKLADEVAKIDQIAAGYRSELASLGENNRFQLALLTAQAMSEISNALTPELMQPMLSLQGSKIGFRTDKQYNADTIRTALIEAIMIGVYPVNNEFNVIAGNCYVTKEGLTRLLRQYPGLTSLRINLGVPKMLSGGAIVECSAEWKIKGQPDSIECEIPIKVNNAMGADAILGKAERKLKARIYAQITGSEIGDGEVEDMQSSAQPEIKRAQQNPQLEAREETRDEPKKSFVSQLTEKAQEEGLSMTLFTKWAQSKGLSLSREVHAEQILTKWDKLPFDQLRPVEPKEPQEERQPNPDYKQGELGK